MGQLHSAAMFACCRRLGRAEDKELLPLTGATAVGVTHCKMERGHGHSLSRGGDEEMPRSLRKDTFLAPRSSGVSQALPTQPGPGSVCGARTSPSLIACPTATPRGCFPTQLTSTAASLPCGAWLPEPGRARDNAPGTGTDSCQQQPPKHDPAPEASLNPPDLTGTLSRSPATSQAGPGSASTQT